MLDFYVYEKNTLVAHVWLDKDLNVHQENYNSDIAYNPILKPRTTIEQVMTFLESRCTSRHNAGINLILKQLGLSKYNIMDILRITQGTMIEDFWWIRFADQPELRWEDLPRARIFD